MDYLLFGFHLKFYHNEEIESENGPDPTPSGTGFSGKGVVLGNWVLFMSSWFGVALVAWFHLEYRKFRRGNPSACPPSSCDEVFRSPYFSVIGPIPNYWLGGIFYSGMGLYAAGKITGLVPVGVSIAVLPVAVLSFGFSVFLLWILKRENLSCRICQLSNGLTIFLSLLAIYQTAG